MTVRKATELDTFKRLIACYVNFTSVFKKFRINVMRSKNFLDWRAKVERLA